MQETQVKAVYFSGGDVLPWEKAESHELKENIRGGVPKKKTQFRMLWTDDAIWVRFDCEDDDPVATMTKFNDDLFNEDVAEVFITPNNRRRYHEFEVAPNGNGMHLIVHNTMRGYFFANKLREDKYFRRIYKNKDGWVAEYALPFAIFNRYPKAGDSWLMNAHRCDLNPDGKTQEISSLSPTYWLTFHRPKAFVPVTFIKE